MSNEPPAACQHCGLYTAAGGAYCCYGCELAASIAAEGASQRTELRGVLTFSLLLSMMVMMLSLFLFAEDVYDAGADAGLTWMRRFYRIASGVLSTPVVVMLGAPLLRRALRALAARRLTMDLLIATGAAAAYGISVVALLRNRGGVYFDSATSALLLSTLGRYLEATARASASRVIAPSLRLAAAPVLAADAGTEEYRRMRPAEIVPGMRLRVGIEEVLPVDALIGGEPGSAVEVTLGVLTGSATPVTRRAGDELPAGAVPVSGALDCVALRSARASTLERLAELSRNLKDRPSRLQRLADAFAAVLVPAVAVLALATLVATTMRSTLESGVNASLAVVLAACPCTYGVATSLVLWLALRKALDHGVCIRSAAAVEELAAVTTVAFDKTGTLTLPTIALLGAELSAAADPREVQGLVAALEAGSRHPVALALERWAGDAAPAAIDDRRVVVGSGVAARDGRGRRLLLGSRRWLRDHGVRVEGDAAIEAYVRVALARDGEVLARFRIGESLRPEASAAVKALAAQGIHARVLTGDSSAGARAVAEPLGIPAYAELSPVDKLARLEPLGKSVAMVGDGVNDAPALASVGPSFAMAGGTSLAQGMAQVTLLHEDLRLVPWTLALARRAMQVGWQNMVGSTLYNLVFLALAATGSLRPVWAGISMLTSSLLTLLSSLRVNAGPEPDDTEPAEVPPLTPLAGALS